MTVQSDVPSTESECHQAGISGNCGSDACPVWARDECPYEEPTVGNLLDAIRPFAALSNYMDPEWPGSHPIWLGVNGEPALLAGDVRQLAHILANFVRQQAEEVPGPAQLGALERLVEDYQPEWHYAMAGKGYKCSWCDHYIYHKSDSREPQLHDPDCLFIWALHQIKGGQDATHQEP